MKRFASFLVFAVIAALLTPLVLLKAVGHAANAALFGYMASNGLVLGASAFNKEERVFFDQLLAGFDDMLTFGRNVSKYQVDPLVLERTVNTQVWRPQPYIATSTDGPAGTSISASFVDVTQLSVPIGIGYNKVSPWQMTTNDLLDKQQLERKMQAAYQKLATDINLAIATVAGTQGTLTVKRTSAPSGYDDLSEADSMMLEQGLVGVDSNRKCFLHARHYNSMASALAKPQTSANAKVNSAFEKSYVGQVAGFDTFKSDYTYNLTVRAGVTVTVNGANQRFVPAALKASPSSTERVNQDNRYQNLTIGVVSGTVKVGDRFTIAGVNAVHHITKADTGQLKTFTITAIVSGGGGAGVVQISPPIIAADSAPTQPELEYKNVTATPANGAAITFLNTATGNVAPFWDERAIELLPGREGWDPDMEANGAARMVGTTELGVQVVLYKFFDINTKTFKYRCDTRFGVGMTNPEMAGVILFSQV
jgi:hypothetical protein